MRVRDSAVGSMESWAPGGHQAVGTAASPGQPGEEPAGRGLILEQEAGQAAAFSAENLPVCAAAWRPRMAWTAGLVRWWHWGRADGSEWLRKAVGGEYFLHEFIGGCRGMGEAGGRVWG